MRTFTIDLTNQWKGYCMIDLIHIGWYSQGQFDALCITLFGFGIDFEWWKR